MVSKDSSSVSLGIEGSFNLFSLSSTLSSFVDNLLKLSSGVTWESFGVMWDVNSSIACSIKSTEESGSGCGSSKTNIKKSLEWSFITFFFCDVVFPVNGRVVSCWELGTFGQQKIN